MQDNLQDSSTRIPSSDSSPVGASATMGAGPTPTTRNDLRAPALPPSGGGPRIHPLWLALTAAVLFGLVFGLGALVASNRASTSFAPSGTTIEATTINVVKDVSPSVVKIQARRAVGAAGGVGSGEILSTSGYIVTNDHVVRGFSSITVLLSNGTQVPATLVGEAPMDDLAVLKISANDLKPITIGDSNQAQVGEYALALGSPLGLEQSTTFGIISALNRQVNEIVDGQLIAISGMLQTSAPINPGNSGGALVNMKGQLIGIPTLAAVEPSTGVAANGIGFAISSDRMKTIVSQLTNGAV